jgi:hypothetical protein
MSLTPIRSKWKGNTTGRERFLNQLNHRAFDRSFNMEFGYWEENYHQWDIFINHGILNYKQANEFFSFDRIETIDCDNWMCPPFEEKIIDETDRNVTMINTDGIYVEIPKDRHATIPHYVKPTVVTPEDWKKCKEEHFRLDDPRRKIDIKVLKDRFPEGEERDYPLGVYVGSMIGKIRDMLTFEGICYAIFDYPEMVEDMVETCCRIVENSLDELLPNFRFDFASGWEDICYKNGPIVTVDFFRDVVVPRYKRIGKKLQKYGIEIWYIDCDGDVRPLLPYFLEGGVNCLFPYEVNSASHPGKLLDEYGGELRIMGGVDKMKLIEGREAIKAYLESIEPWVAKGGYIPFCDHCCPPDVTPENYIYYLDLKEKMFGLG